MEDTPSLGPPMELARRLVNPAVVILVILGLVLVGGTVGTGLPAVDDTINDAHESVVGMIDNATGQSTPGERSDDATGERAGGGSPGPGVAGSSDGSISTVEIEIGIHRAVNEQRRATGVTPLDFDPTLRRVARYHSTQMAELEFFSHTSPDGGTFVDRYERFDYECRVSTGPNAYATGGENIAFTYADSAVLRDSGGTVNYEANESRIATGIVRQWMNSSGHRDNLLQPAWSKEGVGVVLAADDGRTRVYATQNFC